MLQREDALQELGHTSNDGLAILIISDLEDVLKHFVLGLMNRLSLPLPSTTPSDTERNKIWYDFDNTIFFLKKGKRTTRSHQRCHTAGLYTAWPLWKSHARQGRLNL